jgi:tetratricopeptide (TPR) repeat protein
LSAMKLARQHLAAASYDAALASANQALAANPEDADALALQREARGQQAIRLAKIEGGQGHYVAGIKALETALQVLPENEEAKAMLAEFTKQDAAQREQAQQARLALPKMALSTIMCEFNEGSLFETHELTTRQPFAELAAALTAAFETKAPAFDVLPKKLPWAESFGLSGQQELPGGFRRIVIAGAKINDNETHILFKVMDYTTKHDVSFSGKLTFETSYIPLHPSKVGELTPKMKTQMEDGLRLATERIQAVIGQP